jgi:hypothetical protein
MSNLTPKACVTLMGVYNYKSLVSKGHCKQRLYTQLDQLRGDLDHIVSPCRHPNTMI